MTPTARFPRALTLGTLAALAACGDPDPKPFDGDGQAVSLYALTSGIEGVSFSPPLGPEGSRTGPFDAALLDRLRVVLEATDAGGATEAVGSFDRTTTPALHLLAAHELYFVNVPAATYFTNPALAYRFRVLLDGTEIARSDMTPMVFTVLQYVPALPVGVKLRIERRPEPTLTAVSPAAVDAGSADFTLTVDGTNFASDSVVRLDGRDLATAFVSVTRLTATVTSDLVATPGDRFAVVFTAAPGGGASAPAKLVSKAVGDGPGWHYNSYVPWGVSGANNELATFLVAPNDFLGGWGGWFMVEGAHPVGAHTGVHYYELETDIFAPNATTYGPWVMIGAESTVSPNPRSLITTFDEYGYGLYWTADGWSTSRDGYGTWWGPYGATADSWTVSSDTIMTGPGVAGVALDTNTDTVRIYMNDTLIGTVRYPAITYPVVAALTMYGTIGSAKLISDPAQQHYPTRGSGW